MVVGIPAYNEETAIGSVILGSQRFADQVIVVDDGSSDTTARIAETAGAIVLKHGDNRGKGSAIRTLLEYVRSIHFDVFILIDGDGQHQPSDIPRLVDALIKHRFDLVIGSRYLNRNGDGETPFYRRCGQMMLDLLTSSLLDTKLTDTQSGFRALSPEAVETLSLYARGYGIESEMIKQAVAADLQITEKPINVRYDGIDGQTYGPIRHGVSVVYFLLRQFLHRS